MLLLCCRVIVADIFMIVLGLMVRALPAITGSVKFSVPADLISGNVAHMRSKGPAMSRTKIRLSGHVLRLLASIGG